MSEWGKRFISSQEFHELILKLIDKLPKDKYKFVYAIPRGGLIIGVYVSHYLNIPLIVGKYHPSELCIETLIVDDLVDTGITLKEFLDSGFDIAVLQYKPRSSIIPTYYVEERSNEEWITYPFERADEEPNREI